MYGQRVGLGFEQRVQCLLHSVPDHAIEVRPQLALVQAGVGGPVELVRLSFTPTVETPLMISLVLPR
jgi:hypothetical protein